MTHITLGLVKEFIAYDEATGGLTWIKQPSNNVKAGDKIVRLNKRGYVTLKFKEKCLLAHRVAWLLHYGKWPTKHLDHLDGDRTNNVISNLREADDRLNGQNMKIHRDGHLCGTTKSPTPGKWIASIKVNGARRHLGTFGSQAAAHAAYLAAVTSLPEPRR